eukprot:5762611-Pyramimonas_sp.AAC.1
MAMSNPMCGCLGTSRTGCIPRAGRCPPSLTNAQSALEGEASPKKQVCWSLSSPAYAVAPRASAHPDCSMSSRGLLKSPQSNQGVRRAEERGQRR